MNFLTAISVKQPHASRLFLDKLIETRTWAPVKDGRPFRGPLLICSGQTVDVAAMRLAGIPPDGWEDKYPPGLALGVIHIVDARPMVKADEAAAKCGYRPGLLAWVRSSLVHRLARPFPVRGQLGLFQVQVPDDAWGEDPALTLPLNPPQGER